MGPEPWNATTYGEWAAAVRSLGGVATVMPHDAGTVAGARYPATVWVPLVNAHAWALPDDYSADGNWGYYRAPELVTGGTFKGEKLPGADVVATQPTTEEAAQGADEIMSDWSSKATTYVGGVLGQAGVVLAIGVVVLFLLNRRK